MFLILLLAAIAGLVMIYYYILFRPTKDARATIDNKKDLLHFENEARKTFFQWISGLVVLIGAISAWQQYIDQRESEKHTQLLNEEQMSILRASRYTSAVTMLGDANEAVRLGGLYELEQLAAEDKKNYGKPVASVVIGFVRRRARWSEAVSASEDPRWINFLYAEDGRVQREEKRRSEEIGLSEEEFRDYDLSFEAHDAEMLNLLSGHKNFWPPTDLEGALDLLGRIDTYNMELNLSGLVLIGCNLRGTNFVGADFSYSLLVGCRFSKANLAQAKFFSANIFSSSFDGGTASGADFSGAVLSRSQMRNTKVDDALFLSVTIRDAHLWHLDLTATQWGEVDARWALIEASNFSGQVLSGTKLRGARLYNSDFSNARFGIRHSLQLNEIVGVSFRQADINNVVLSGDIKDVDFAEANLISADLTGLIGLLEEDIQNAKGDRTTRLPPGITMPPSWQREP